MKYDIVVIGGGPAGLMAAGRAGELGAHVVLLERNPQLGFKLLMTGGGRCNLTNKIEEPRKLVEKYGVNGKFLFSAFNRFGVNETIEFFEARGVKTKVEANNRVLPVSDRADDVLKALLSYLKKSKVEVRTRVEVKEIIKKSGKIEKIIITDVEEILADKFIITTGGKSYPPSGSTGDGYKWLKKLGHEIIDTKPILTPVVVKDKIVKDLEGLSLKDIKISLFRENKKIESQNGEAIFTKDGLSGPLILDLSRTISRELPAQLKLRLDFFSQLDLEELDKKLQAYFKTDNNKSFKNFLAKLLAPKLVLVILKLSGTDPDKKVNSISREERQKLVRLLKEFDLEVDSLAGYDKAMVTAGGVKLSEVDPKSMRSKLIDNLYLAGEILDLDGPTGGFNLQICWSTGYVAGESAV